MRDSSTPNAPSGKTTVPQAPDSTRIRELRNWMRRNPLIASGLPRPSAPSDTATGAAKPIGRCARLSHRKWERTQITVRGGCGT